MSNVVTVHMILAIDPGRSCGYAVFDAKDESITIVAIGAFDIKAKDAGEAMSRLRDEIEKLVRAFAIEFVHMEQYFFNKKFPNGAEFNYYLRGAVLHTLYDWKIPSSQHAPTTWKKFICGKARPSPTDVALYGPKAAKTFVKVALENTYDLKLPPTAKVGCKHLKLRHDTVDAIAIGIYGICCENPRKVLIIDSFPF